MSNRYPGLYVPQTPPKKAIGNKGAPFLESRRLFLYQFLLKLTKIDYLFESDEFKMFSRPGGDIEKTLMKLPRPSTASQIEKYKSILGINTVSALV